MKLIAKKPCSFNGKKFFIGNEIPESYVLDPKAQVAMGVIEVVEGEGIKAAPEEGGPLLPPSSTLEETMEEQEEEKSYSKGTLTHMTKDELLAIAEEKGVEATVDMTKSDIADLIIATQGE